MERYSVVLVTLLGLTSACQTNNAAELEALNRRVAALEKKAASGRPAARRPNGRIRPKPIFCPSEATTLIAALSTRR